MTTDVNALMTIDLGNSENRIIVKTGKFQSSPIIFPNYYANVGNSYTIPEGYLADPEDSYVFEVASGIGVGRWSGGSLAQREFSSSLIVPTALTTKYDANAITTVLSLNVAFFEAYRVLREHFGSNNDDFNVIWDVVVCLPAADYSNALKMEEVIRGISSIDFTLPEDFSRDITVRNVKVVPEGVAAFFAVLFDNKKKLRSQYANLKDSSILIMDIGAGTTDISVIQDFRVIDDTRTTLQYGGNNVYQRVSKILRDEGYITTPQSVREAVITGKIKDGAIHTDITDSINKAKQLVAQSMVQGLRSFFESTMFNPREIAHILVVGGGSISGVTEPISTPLLTYMRDLSPHVEILDLPTVKHIDGDNVVVDTINPRTLNVIGASIMAG